MYKIPDKTVFMGKKIISLPSCESTNSLMISMAQADKLEEGSIIITENQTSGRGQAGNRWVTEAGTNLTFSALLKPVFLEPSNQFYLNMAVGLAMHDAVTDFVLTKTEVKWPNDVMVDGKKVCGILIENQIHGQQFTQAVIGIGLNVNQKNFEWPQASSLCLCAGRYFSKAEVLEKVLMQLENRYHQLKKKDFNGLQHDYHAALYWKDEAHEFMQDGKIFSGTITGIDEVGRLQLRMAEGIRKFNFKEITFVL
jgi:BirA family transcriptional regulator, biotin operon repressor / biotin---[acetyl-CoA-carboxylase] ligase